MLEFWFGVLFMKKNYSEVKEQEHEQARRSPFLDFLLVMFSTLFVICAGILGFQLYSAKCEKDNYNELAQIAGTVQTEQKQDEPQIKEPTREERFAQLSELNPDFVGWLSIPGTKVNYPVVYTPSKPEYYLRRNFYGKKAVGGVPFEGAGCTDDGNSIIIHGHNMDNGTMFADIMKYKDESYFKEHPIVHYDTPEQDGEYEVMSAFYYDATLNEDPGHFNLYNYAGRLNEAAFGELIAQTSRLSQYDTGVTAEYGDRILILSTCSYHTQNGRFLLMARQKGGMPQE